jgi:hypothetical protein
MPRSRLARWFAPNALRGPNQGRILRATQLPLRLEWLEERLAPASLSGTVFEDVNYGGGPGRSLATSAGVGRGNARVELFDSAGNFLTATTTSASGAYTFTGLADGTSYSVRVVNSTVASSRPGNSAGLFPVETFQTDASSGTVVPVTTDVGGAVPSAQDSGAKGPGGNLNDAAVEQSVTRVTVGTGVASVTGLDFGFNFDTVVNTNNAGQGSVAQFILNSNALGNTGLAQVGQTPGVETSIFMIPSTADPLGRPADPNFSGGVAHITLTTALPAITDANTNLNGATQTANIGNTNNVTLGTGGTVGVGPDGVAGTGDELALPTLNGPEVEIHGANSVATGVSIGQNGNNATVQGLAVYGFGMANIFVGQNSNNALIKNNVLGSTATSFTDPGPGVRTAGANILVPAGGTNNGVVQNNLIGFAGAAGVNLTGGAATWQITGNEIRSNGLITASAAGVDLSGQNTVNDVVRGNLITGNSGFGINLFVSNGNATVNQNTITGNGIGGVQTAGVAIGVANDTVSNNIISANYGAGVLVGSGALGNPITKNSIFANGTIPSATGAPPSGQIGIDLLTHTDDPNAGTPPFVTLNRPGSVGPGGNGLLNFPVLVTAMVVGSNLELTGFARPGSAIELFIANPDPSGFGEGQTFLTTLVEGSAADLDGTIGSYGPGPINGIVQGSDTTNRFRFVVPLSSLTKPITSSTILTATATVANNTSEFSGNVTVATVVTPVLTTTPAPTSVMLDSNPVTLTDTAKLSGGNSPTGMITFMLFFNGGSTPVHTETVMVNGNGNYTTPTGFTLPTTGMVVGTYQWDATYNGDMNNNAVSDNNSVNEQVIVSAASPMLTTTPTPTSVPLGATAPPILTDSATLSGGFHPTGTITFTLLFNGGATPVHTETVTVNGNSTYTTPTGFTLPTTGMVAGTYQWDATYNGDPNNNTASDKNATNEQVIVSPATPAITTTAEPSSGNVGVTLQDTADLTGGFHAIGTITFKLFAPGVDPTVGPAVHTETVTVNGDGTYSTTTGFVSNVSGVWHWVATYGGDPNNQSVASGPLEEPVTLAQNADLALTKMASPSQVVLGVNVVYTLTVHNLGPGGATDVAVADQFPAGIALVGPFAPSQGTFDPATGAWNIGSLPNGGSATLIVVAQVQTLGPLVNSATVKADQLDPDLSNNTDTAMVTGMRPAGLVSKQFFLDSFTPAAVNLANAVFAAEPASARVTVASTGLLHQAADPVVLDSLFAALGKGSSLPQSGAAAAGAPANVPAGSRDMTSGPLGPLFGDTLASPGNASAVVARGPAGGASSAEVAANLLAGVEADQQMVVGL